MENGVFVMIVFVSLGSFAMVAFIVFMGIHARNRKATLQSEVQTRLIDKFNNAPDFVDFLNSDTGKQFLTGIDKMPKLMARDRIVGGEQDDRAPAPLLRDQLGPGLVSVEEAAERLPQPLLIVFTLCAWRGLCR